VFEREDYDLSLSPFLISCREDEVKKAKSRQHLREELCVERAFALLALLKGKRDVEVLHNRRHRSRQGQVCHLLTSAMMETLLE